MTTRIKVPGSNRIAGKVRPLSPADLGLLWWDGTDTSRMWKDTGRTSPVTANDDGIASWGEKTTGNYLTRTVGNNNPRYRTNAGDGTAAVFFDAAPNPDWLDVPSGVLTGAADIELFILFNNWPYGLLSNGGTPTIVGAVLQDAFASSKRYIIGDPATVQTGFYVYSAYGGTNKWDARFNGQWLHHVPINTVNNAAGPLGSQTGVTGINAMVRDFILCRRVLTSYERAGLMAWFANRAALSIVTETPTYPVLVAGGTTCMRLQSSLAYCPIEIMHRTNGRHYLTIPTYNNSATSEGSSFLTGNSTVINYSSTFFGPTHGGQTNESTTLSIDGNARTFPRDPHYTGTSLVFTRQWVAGTAMRINEQSTITNGSIVNAVTMTGIDATKTLTIVYGRLWGLHNRFTNWATYDAAGALVGSTSSGTLANAENNAATNFDSGTRTVLCRDPSTNDTISFRWTGLDALSPAARIEDQSGINKIYLVLGALQTTANRTDSIGETITITNAGYSSSWPPSSPAGL